MSSNATAVSPGIYRITCTANGRFYIGSAVNLRKRRSTHFIDLRNNRHHSITLQRAWNKYGPESIVFEVLEYVLLPDLLTAREQYYLDTLKPFGRRGFNTVRVAGSNLGYKHTSQARKIMSAKRRGKAAKRSAWKHTPEGLARIGIASHGRKDSDATRQKRSEASQKKAADPEWRAKTLKTLSVIRIRRMRTVLITAPDGTEYTVTGITPFCKEHGIHSSSLIMVAQGKRHHAQGWKARYVETDIN